MSFFDSFDRYIFNRMNDFFRTYDEEPPLMITSSKDTPTNGGEKSLAGRRGGAGLLSAKLDLIEKPNEYLVNVELPGVRKEDINVQVENGMLSVLAERKEERRQEDKESRYHYSERRYGSIRRVISLPEGADAERVNAAFNDGVLSLTFAKKPESSNRKQITIS
jgi:HSP20 family protein